MISNPKHDANTQNINTDTVENMDNIMKDVSGIEGGGQRLEDGSGRLGNIGWVVFVVVSLVGFGAGVWVLVDVSISAAAMPERKVENNITTIEPPASIQTPTPKQQVKSKIQIQYQRFDPKKNLQPIDPITVRNLFLDHDHNSRYFSNLYEYLLHNKVSTILDVNSDLECRLELLQNGDSTLQVTHASTLNEVETGKQFDWVMFEGVDSFVTGVLAQETSIASHVRFGVAVRERDLNFLKRKTEEKMQEYFVSRGFVFDEAKSLTLRKPENKLVWIFLRRDTVQRDKRVIPGLNKPERNFLAISTILKIKENLPYLREWIGYHIHIGVDKFFLYDNSNASKYYYDPMLTKSKNKYGMDLRCINFTEQQVNKEWQDIWTQFYDHIVYLKWELKDETGSVVYGQVESQQDYMKYFRNVVAYTSFTDADEFIFSPKGYDIRAYILEKAKSNVTLITMYQRHFECRFCVSNSRVTSIYHFFRQRDWIYWAPKLIAQTKYFIPFGSIHDGKTSHGNKIKPSPEQIRFNHYNFQLFNLAVARAKGFSVTVKFQIDEGMKRYRGVISEICKDRKCSENFTLQCPEGFEYNNCLNTSKTYPFELQLNVTQDYIDARPRNSKNKLPPPQYKPIPPAQNANIFYLPTGIEKILTTEYNCTSITKVTVHNISASTQSKILSPASVANSVSTKSPALPAKSASSACAVFAEPEFRIAFLFSPDFDTFFVMENQRSELPDATAMFIQPRKYENLLQAQRKVIDNANFLVITRKNS